MNFFIYFYFHFKKKEIKKMGGGSLLTFVHNNKNYHVYNNDYEHHDIKYYGTILFNNVIKMSKNLKKWTTKLDNLNLKNPKNEISKNDFNALKSDGLIENKLFMKGQSWFYIDIKNKKTFTDNLNNGFIILFNEDDYQCRYIINFDKNMFYVIYQNIIFSYDLKNMPEEFNLDDEMVEIIDISYSKGKNPLKKLPINADLEGKVEYEGEDLIVNDEPEIDDEYYEIRTLEDGIQALSYKMRELREENKKLKKENETLKNKLK